MGTAQLTLVIRYLRRLTAPGIAALTDGQLLARFAAHREEAGFTALLLRHGPMVLLTTAQPMHRRMLPSPLYSGERGWG
ncbi:MAG TPA: hypothetical protein VG013_27265 [Gemmataceae bacterium]|jgi:hypothetical protein|nr:hypothetical protein [Gemmataceae bacterium]